MVRFYHRCCLLIIASCIFTPHLNALVKISSEIVKQSATENHSLEGLISIFQDEGLPIDPKSFRLGNKPLEVEFLGENKTSSIATSTQSLFASSPGSVFLYRFYIGPQPKGLYVLSSISVKIGEKIYSSPSVTYEVFGTQRAEESFRFEAQIDGKQPFFPGSRLNFVYRIYFRENIELTYQELPLLALAGFQNIGSAINSSYTKDNYTVQEIVQRVEALSEGAFKVPTSAIEGVPYIEDASGQKNYQNRRLRAEAPGMVVTVQPFPEKNKPLTFNGSLGIYDWKVSLLTPTTIKVGDKVTLEIIFTGKGELESLRLPQISSQAGFEKFRFNDLPPLGQIARNSKRFLLDIRPLDPELKMIPSFEFSSFDPETQKYFTLKSPTFPLNVESLQSQDELEKGKEVGGEQSRETSQDAWRQALTKPDKIEVESNEPLSKTELEGQSFRLANLIWSLLTVCGVIFLQIRLKAYFSNPKNHLRDKTAYDFLYEALKEKDHPSTFFLLIRQALLMRLFEKKVTSSLVGHVSKLTEVGICGEVRTFLMSIDEKRFTGQEIPSTSEIYLEAKRLFQRIES